MRHLEYQEQVAIFQWASLLQKRYPSLQYLYSSQAGEKFKNHIAGARAKRAGLRAGVPDIFLPLPQIQYCPNQCGARQMVYAGLYIELKRPKRANSGKGAITAAQKDFLEYLNVAGYKAVVCYGAQEAIAVIEEYILQCEQNLI